MLYIGALAEPIQEPWARSGSDSVVSGFLQHGLLHAWGWRYTAVLLTPPAGVLGPELQVAQWAVLDLVAQVQPGSVIP